MRLMYPCMCAFQCEINTRSRSKCISVVDYLSLPTKLGIVFPGIIWNNKTTNSFLSLTLPQWSWDTGTLEETGNEWIVPEETVSRPLSLLPRRGLLRTPCPVSWTGWTRFRTHYPRAYIGNLQTMGGGEAVYNRWTGLVDWTSGLDWWTRRNRSRTRSQTDSLVCIN